MFNTEFSFELITQHDQARLGIITTPKGVVDTPAFMPVGTQGTVKGVFTDDIIKTGTQIILGNTYHLLLRPGTEIIKKFNGLHNFMNWNKPILTDSGGYQIMSLSKFNKIDPKIGAIFTSHLDGKKIILSPEKSIQVQKSINSDIIMVLDECPKHTEDKNILSKAIDVSTQWAKRCKTEFGNDKSTGKTPMQHALAYAEEKNPTKEKKRCISFIKKTNSEACAIAKKQIALTQAKLKEKTKSVLKKIPSIKKSVFTKEVTRTTLSPRGQAFAEARKEKKESFIFEGKIYNTRFKSMVAEKIIAPKNQIFVEKKNINKDPIKPKKSVIELALEVQTKIKEYDKRWKQRKSISKVEYLD